MALFKSKKKQAAELFETGSKGAGTVVSVQDTGMTVNDNPRVKMTFWFDAQDPAGTWAYATIADDNGRATMRQLFGDVAETFVGMNAPAAPAAVGGGQDVVEQIKQLADLHSQGILTDEEFAAQKAKLLG
jgi:hypothetical protein